MYKGKNQSKLTALMLAVLVSALVWAVPAQAAITKSISLVKGWNLVSMPVQADNATVGAILNGIDYETAWVFDGEKQSWKAVAPNGTVGTFPQISEINAGEGFWINAKSAQTLTVTGNTPNSFAGKIVKGWSLIGLKQNQAVGADDVHNTLKAQGADIEAMWAWDAANSGWEVKLPKLSNSAGDSYIKAKGFKEFSMISEKQGFWVNAGGNATYSEEPPQPGKVYLAGDNQSLTPLANAKLYFQNGSLAGTTDGNGNVNLPSGLPDNTILKIGDEGKYTISVGAITNGVLYMVAQVQDPATALNSTNGSAKPTPKSIASGDGTASVSIQGLQLTSDMTVSVTSYASPGAIPFSSMLHTALKEYNSTGEYMFIGGADMSYYDALGNPTTLEATGFGASFINATVNKFFSDIDGEELYKKLGNGTVSKALGSIVVAEMNGTAWKVLGAADLNVSESLNKDNSTDFTFRMSTGTTGLGSLYPYVFAYKQDYLKGNFTVTVTNKGLFYNSTTGGVVVTTDTQGKGAVLDESYGDPVSGAMLYSSASDEFYVTDENGTAVISYIVPPDSPIVSVNVVKDGYEQDLGIVNVIDDTTLALGMLERPVTAAIGGEVYDTQTSAGIPNATVTLANPLVLDQIADNGTAIIVGASNSTYTWQMRRVNGTKWATILEGAGENVLTRNAIKTTMITGYASLNATQKEAIGANPAGAYELKITVLHKFSNTNVEESTSGVLDIAFDLEGLKGTGSLSQGSLGSLSVFGGKDLGFYWATGPLGVNFEWKSFIRFYNDKATTDTGDDETQVLFQSNGSTLYYYSFVDAINLITNNYLALLQPYANGTTKSYLEDGFTVRVGLKGDWLLGGQIAQNGSTQAEFDVQTSDPLSLLSIGKLQITPNTTKAFSQTQKTDEEGNFLFPFLEPELEGLLALYAKKLEYLPNSIFLTAAEYPLVVGNVTEANIGLDPLNPANSTEPTKEAKTWVENFDNATTNSSNVTTENGVWSVTTGNTPAKWQIATNAETYAPAAAAGIDYPVFDAADNATLPPAVTGNSYAWFGVNSTMTTFSATGSNTSAGKVTGVFMSPTIDLTNFAFATMMFNTWFELESVDIAKGQYDQIKVYVGLAESEFANGTVTLGELSFTNANDFKLVSHLNPDQEAAIQSAGVNFSSGGNDAVPVWIEEEVNLDFFAGHKIVLKFDFDSKDSLYNGWRGWGVDQIKIANEESGLPFEVNNSDYSFKAPVRDAE